MKQEPMDAEPKQMISTSAQRPSFLLHRFFLLCSRVVEFPAALGGGGEVRRYAEGDQADGDAFADLPPRAANPGCGGSFDAAATGVSLSCRSSLPASATH
jgi:hypothetical protein